MATAVIACGPYTAGKKRASDALRFCFELTTSGTSMDGAELTIEEPAGEGHCRSCGRDFEIDQPLVLCPCGSADVAVVGGDQLLIRSVGLA